MEGFQPADEMLKLQNLVRLFRQVELSAAGGVDNVEDHNSPLF